MELNKKDSILVIVESPNKCKSLSKIFSDLGFSNLKVLASVGHITKIKDNPSSYKNTGIHPDKKFKVDYVVDPKKKEVVQKLKEAVDKSKWVLLMSDPDREGSAIATHLKRELKIPEEKYFRVTVHEITKSAVKAALDNLEKIDDNLSAAAETRQIVDKLMGYGLSPIARNNLNCKSVGRCQSAGLKLVAEREDEINHFVPEKYYDLYLLFAKNATDFKAKYVGTEKEEVKKIPNIETCNAIKKLCEGNDYLIKDIEKKEVKEYPKPPFTTSTFQQEANKLYGISIDQAMSCAQRLFEGIEMKGEHIALITYIRTDDSSMSPEFAETLAKYVKGNYGDKYYAPVKKGAKSDSAQEAHECLRVIDLEMTPEKLNALIKDDFLVKIYKMIWQRTVASSMAPAIIGDTIYTINNKDQLFVMHSREIEFDGYRKIKVDDDSTKEEIVKETFKKGEVLKDCSLNEEYKETTPPKRYTEATFVKEMEKRGIGRPSTFATIVKTILAEDRGYCTLESKMITPTAKGMELSRFLDKSFPDIINLHYTKELEEDLDQIASGKMKKIDFLDDFFKELEGSITKAEGEKSYCPHCGKELVKRKSKYGTFLACSGYPSCKYIKK